MICGLVWTQRDFESTLFDELEDDDGTRFLGNDVERQQRAARVLSLGVTLSQQPNPLDYDQKTMHFSAAEQRR